MRPLTTRRLRALYADLPAEAKLRSKRAITPIPASNNIYSARVGLGYRALGEMAPLPFTCPLRKHQDWLLCPHPNSFAPKQLFAVDRGACPGFARPHPSATSYTGLNYPILARHAPALALDLPSIDSQPSANALCAAQCGEGL